MVIFKKIRWRNILSSGQMMTEVILDRTPSCMISGKNGAGKTTLLDSITFGLFGKPFRKINKPQLVNSKNGRDLLVEIEFDINEASYLVRRGMKPELFEVYKDGQLQNQPGDSRDYQKTLSQIIGFDFPTFIQTVVIGKTQYTPFMKLDSARRRAFVESLLNLLVFSGMNKLHSANVTAHRDKMVELKSAIQVAGEKVTIRQKYIADLEREAIASEQKSAAQAEARIGNLELERETVESVIKSNGAPCEVKKAEQKAVQKRIDQLKELILKFKIKIDSMEAQVRFMRENTVCQSCGQDISEERRANQCRSLDDKIAECERARDTVSLELVSAETKLAEYLKLESEYREWETNHSKLTSKLSLIESQISLLKKELANESDQSGIRVKIKEETARLIELQGIYERLLEKRAEMADQSEYYGVVSMMLKDGGIKSMLIRRYIAIINQAINANLAKLGFFAKFTLNEDFEETIQARGIDTLSYDNFSEGEKLRIDMAILLAWREVAMVQSGVSTNLLIFDEVADNSMDSMGVDMLGFILTSIPNSNIFIITHYPENWTGHFKSHIIFEKVDGFSRIKPA